MMEYKTFRFSIHGDAPADIDTVLNALPVGTCVEGYATAGNELFITVSHYDPYRKEVDQEMKRIELQANK